MRSSSEQSGESESCDHERVGETYDGVDSRHLLADHQPYGDESPLPIARNGKHLLEQQPVGGVTDQPPLHLQLVRHLLDLALDVGVVAGESGPVSKPLRQAARRSSNVGLRCQAREDRIRALPVVLPSTPTRAIINRCQTPSLS